ncbi:fasciclin domain-containing protein [Parvularcula sp. ZS-1/3]|uniref:Fasciclin domain-containing protein n=1 Tax=Parvularcula mediterranea TaxID=2732508 RepID=A0A7Y3RLT4_9PROT|nr:fasciclin domain-containing protein [Parvularcula mediterranea]NNU16345.1 fasciclin domain-containing protein [Parvularcula mediterranea]
MTPFRLLFASLLALGVAACGGSSDEASDAAQAGVAEEPAEEQLASTLLEIIQSEARFSTLAAALDAADLETTFDTEGPLTLFAPSNDAFGSLPTGFSVDVLTAPENQALLQQILAYHVLGERVTSSDITGQQTEVPTVGGPMLRIDASGEIVIIGSEPATALVVVPDIEARNGVIHIIDGVLLPPAE